MRKLQNLLSTTKLFNKLSNLIQQTIQVFLITNILSYVLVHS